jgi:hypothetical protein
MKSMDELRQFIDAEAMVFQQSGYKARYIAALKAAMAVAQYLKTTGKA